jgi:hypothetical protein
MKFWGNVMIIGQIPYNGEVTSIILQMVCQQNNVQLIH